MPSLRKRVSTYLRQLSFHQDAREQASHINFIENTFVVKYLQGEIRLKDDGPKVHTGKMPVDLPSFDVAPYKTGADTTIACYTGPDGGLTAVRRREKHLTLAENEIAFIDTADEVADVGQTSPTTTTSRTCLDNSTMLIKMAGQEYYVTNNKRAISPPVDRTAIAQMAPPAATGDVISNNNQLPTAAGDERRRIARPTPSLGGGNQQQLPAAWQRHTATAYGISDSLYDRNLSTKMRNGTPIADCFGVITRDDSAIMAVADGVNWGEKAAVAAKSAVHASLHYLNRTIFHDTRPFDVLMEEKVVGAPAADGALLTSTRDVLVCLLRAFHCAHALILENGGMLTTLTVGVVLPLAAAPGAADTHVVCVCNVGDSLAYVYSQQHGVRELTRASHDVTANRDMRDALGALGPVDGIKPDLSNLTLSVSTLHEGDLLMMASDGLTDNFDPTVCRFAVSASPAKPPRKRAPPAATSGSSKKTPSAAPSGGGGFAMMRSRTALELRTKIARTPEGLPMITPTQKYELTLLLMEDVLRRGISGRAVAAHDALSARQLCEHLLSFAVSITAAKRRTLEDNDLYFTRQHGVLVELPTHEKRARRKRALERVQTLPGKLDHVTVVACNIANRCLVRQ